MSRLALPVALCAALAVAVAACSSARAPSSRVPSTATAPPAPATVDTLLVAEWREAGITPAPVASDAALVRRVTLDLIGRVPTADEARAYVSDTDPHKKAKLVDRLLASPEHAEHQADVYGDLLFGREARLAGPISRLSAPRDYLVAAFAENRPWDRMAVELITATGSIGDDGATAFLATRAAKGAGPDAAAAATARTFLGLSIQCAQCHDHPYEKRWKQADFVALSAFFAETRIKRQKADGTPTIDISDKPLPKRARARERMKQKAAARGRELPEALFVEPRFLGREIEPREGETRRQTLARAVVASDLFAKAAVNRTWAAFFGAALSDPWDDLGAEDHPDHPPALRLLAAQFVASGYDLRALERAIVLSDAYARSSAGAAATAADAEAIALAERRFARARVRRLSADQTLRSLLAATGIENAGRGRFKKDVERGKQRALREVLFVFPDDEMAEVDGSGGSISQMLLLFCGEVTNLGARAFEGTTLGETLAAIPAADADARLAALTWAAYARPPSAAEQQRARAYLAAHAGDADAAWEDLFFAMLTSTEFLSNH